MPPIMMKKKGQVATRSAVVQEESTSNTAPNIDAVELQATTVVDEQTQPAPPPKRKPLQSEDVIGVYRRSPEENGWHSGVITFKPNTQELQWTNLATKSWNLFVSPGGKRLRTDTSNPYHDTHKEFVLQFHGDTVIGFMFASDIFMRDGVDVLPQSVGGLKGYISIHVDPNIPKEFGYGVSFYTSIWTLVDTPLASFQIGLPSTWIIPDNRDFCENLCPAGTVAGDNWESSRGRTYFRNVFQTVEGGLGYWVSTQFGSPVPKYRINGTPNGYNHEVSSPGFGFGKVEPLKGEELGLAALSNRLLIPPDGFTFDGQTEGLLGNAWMALPLMKKRDGASRHDVTSFLSVPVFTNASESKSNNSNEQRPQPPTGEMCWTLFLNAANFKGPTAFFIPELWSELSRRYPTIIGRGLDAKPGTCHGGAMEINTVPYFKGKQAKDGKTYTRIPKLRFPVNEDGHSVLMRDITMYSPNALFSRVKTWMSGGVCANPTFSDGVASRYITKLVLKPQIMRQGPENLLLSKLEDCYKPAIVSEEREGESTSHAFVLKWKQEKNSSDDSTDTTNTVTPTTTPGMFPEYFKSESSDNGDVMVPVAKSEVPEETELTRQHFLEYDHKSDYEMSNPKDTQPPEPLGPHTVKLQDGSIVHYRWYRFVDQPSLRCVQWLPHEQENLQRVVEELHKEWTNEKEYMPPPGKGDLVALDPAQILEPPKGYEVGYVPVALKQVAAQEE